MNGGQGRVVRLAVNMAAQYGHEHMKGTLEVTGLPSALAAGGVRDVIAEITSRTMPNGPQSLKRIVASAVANPLIYKFLDSKTEEESDLIEEFIAGAIMQAIAEAGGTFASGGSGGFYGGARGAFDDASEDSAASYWS